MTQNGKNIAEQRLKPRPENIQAIINKKESHMKFCTKMVGFKPMMKNLGLFLVAGALLAGCATLPKDNAQLTELKFEGLMGSRYTEILLVFGNALTSNYMAGVYNTMGLNGANPAGGGDSSPAAILAKIDMKKVKEDSGESLFLRKLLWASLPNKRQKLRDRLCLRRPQPSCFTRCIPNKGYAT